MRRLPARASESPSGGAAAGSSKIFMRKCEVYAAVEAGFQIVTLPIMAGAVGRLPLMETKLKYCRAGIRNR